MLGLSVSIQSLDYKVSSTNNFNHSSHWQFRSDIEWSIDIESKVSIKSLGHCLRLLVNIEDSPSLVVSIVVRHNIYVTTFNVTRTANIKVLMVLDIDEFLILVVEELPPVGVRALHSHIL